MIKRDLITTYILDKLKQINGQTSTYNPDYIYSTDLMGKVYEGLKFYDEIHDFPCIYASEGREYRFYHESYLTEGLYYLTLRCYISSYDRTALDTIDGLIQDIEHIVDHLEGNPEIGLEYVDIMKIQTDNGILDPDSIAEVTLLVSREIEL